MDDERHWYDDDRLYSSGRDSDDSPILSYSVRLRRKWQALQVHTKARLSNQLQALMKRQDANYTVSKMSFLWRRTGKNYKRYDKSRRLSPYASPKLEDRGKRGTLTVLAKFFLFCTAMILFCVLLYIPVYNKANDQQSKGAVQGWSKQTNRDTKIYVRPDNLTTVVDPVDVCPKNGKDKLFLLIVVCSSTIHFNRRVAIRDTWGKYKGYLKMAKLYHEVKQKYENYNYTYDLYPQMVPSNVTRVKRDISSFSQLFPELAKALQDNLVTPKTDEVPEKRFDDESVMLPEFDMNEEIGDQTEPNYEYYETNVMKIPPNGYDDMPALEKVLSKLSGDVNFRKLKEKLSPKVSNMNLEFKVVFLLGLPSNDNDSTIQHKIIAESIKYGDVIQEGFIDSYNNLTLKSIMMLKWITSNCNDSVRYILKTDDDMYINVPNLIENLRERSSKFEEIERAKGRKLKEKLLIGDLICGARPVLDSNNKWYSPRYMYQGRVYPRYLSGTGYALSGDVAEVLYKVALRTDYFHLEDVFITGMCAARARPRVVPRDDPSFSYLTPAGWSGARACGAHARATAHRVTPKLMRKLNAWLSQPSLLDTCERQRLTKVRRDRLKSKATQKHPKKIS